MGSVLSKKLFPKSNPIGKTVRIGTLNLQVIGVIKKMGGVSDNLQSMGINDYNNEIYVPIQSLLSRYKDRGKVTITDEWSWDNGGKENPNQLDKIIVQLKNSEDVAPSGALMSRMLNRRHNEVEDFAVSIPEQTLKQQKETDDLLDLLLDRFEELTEHPLGTDLIYYPETPEDGTPERITEIVKEWRESQGLPCFKG